MKVLIACEYSGITRDAFSALGCDAYSCDLLPTTNPGKHYQKNALEVLHLGFDLLIAHPPCTRLSYAGMNVWSNPDKTVERINAAMFFMQLYNAPIKHVCIENPQGIMSKIFREPNQEIHPYFLVNLL